MLIRGFLLIELRTNCESFPIEAGLSIELELAMLGKNMLFFRMFER